MGYRDIYGKPNNELFKNKIDNIQNKASIETTGVIQGVSSEHLYQELGLKSLKDRYWYQKLMFLS